jgi:penicillin amidase
MSRSWSRCAALAAVLSAIIAASSGTYAAPARATAPARVSGEEATVIRDAFGRPHIFARSNYALFEAYGYAVAEDRLWQLELNRRAARGRLAEIFGLSVLPADRVARTVGYTDEELDAQFGRLNEEEQEIFEAYRDGINRYLEDVVAPDPQKLPFEFQALGFAPGLWEIRDSIAFGAFMTRRFGEIGGRHLVNQAFLESLINRFGPEEGYAMFNDARWVNDPDAPVTVPFDPDQAGPVRRASRPTFKLSQLEGAGSSFTDREVEARAIWERLGVVTKLGSYAWVVSPGRSANGSAMLYGGPQMGFSAPEVLHEVQLTGGRGFDVTGMAFAGTPPVLIGRTAHHAWTSTTATGGNVDIYIERICGPQRYLFQEVCRPMETRSETIVVKGEPPVQLTVLRTVHGPVVDLKETFAASQKRAHWQREVESVRPFLAFDRARNLDDFEVAARQVVTSHNFLYADRDGNIAYWQAGQVPVRPAGFDPRLPFPGDGSAEWPGGILPMPTSINPAQGYLANWNNKPAVDYDNADSQLFGKQFRLLDLRDRLSKGQISLEDMRDIPKDIARVGGLGRESRYLLPYLLGALDAVPPQHRLAPRARQVLESWDENIITDAITSSSIQAGEIIFSSWLTLLVKNTFSAALAPHESEASTNMLLHVLDAALGEGSGVPPSRDYFDGKDPQAALSAAFDAALTGLEGLGPDPDKWERPRPATNFVHPVVGPVGSIPSSNRATYAQIVELSPSIRSENIFTLGQSGFIEKTSSGFRLDPHFLDQLDLYRQFRYKPMRLLADNDR